MQLNEVMITPKGIYHNIYNGDYLLHNISCFSFIRVNPNHVVLSIHYLSICFFLAVLVLFQ